MAKLNRPREGITTHEGATAKHINPTQQLRRSVMACLLWEKQFYEDGDSIADRIIETIPKVDPAIVAGIAIEAREDMKLRHVPLLIAREMARLPSHKGLVAVLLERIIQRPDELAEFLAIYWKDDDKAPLSAQVKKGLARAFPKFNSYSLAKYNRDGVVKLRDVLFLTHPKPKDDGQQKVWDKLVDGTLEPPDTWEVNLSAGEDKKATWGRLILEKKLGGLALLRNLRNMEQVGLDREIIRLAILEMKTDRILPYRFISAAKHAANLEPALEISMMKCLEGQEKLPGYTVLLIDVSGSMTSPVSGKSDITRLDAANGMAMMAREICEEVDIFTFSFDFKQVAPRRGFALRDAIFQSQEASGTMLGSAVKAIYAPRGSVVKHMAKSGSYWMDQVKMFHGQGLKPDRLIVFTDEQSHDPVPDPSSKGFMLNPASSQNGVGYGAWHHIDGWSEACISYIREMETKPM